MPENADQMLKPETEQNTTNIWNVFTDFFSAFAVTLELNIISALFPIAKVHCFFQLKNPIN